MSLTPRRWIEVFVVLGGIALVVAQLRPKVIRARSRGGLTQCKSNLKNIGTALEMYSTDYEGKYPSGLSSLVPNYLKAIPDCSRHVRGHLQSLLQ